MIFRNSHVSLCCGSLENGGFLSLLSLCQRSRSCLMLSGDVYVLPGRMLFLTHVLCSSEMSDMLSQASMNSLPVTGYSTSMRWLIMVATFSGLLVFVSKFWSPQMLFSAHFIRSCGCGQTTTLLLALALMR
jgi:hypothetical protein